MTIINSGGTLTSLTVLEVGSSQSIHGVQVRRKQSAGAYKQSTARQRFEIELWIPTKVILICCGMIGMLFLLYDYTCNCSARACYLL